MSIPGRFDHLVREPGGADWVERLPTLVDECVAQWSLRVGAQYEYGYVSLAVRADLPDGTRAVLKVGFPHRESEHEADALEHYDGVGAVRLLARDRERGALLLERCEPGTTLLAEPGETDALRIGVEVLARLWRVPSTPNPFRPIAADAARWVEELPTRWERLGRPFERVLLDEALVAFVDLPPTQGELVVCHQDLHRGNILRAKREPWLAIDPKPVLAEREFDTVALIRDADGDPVWLDFLAAELALDRERMRRWALAHTLAWSFDESDPDEAGIEVARRLAAART